MVATPRRAISRVTIADVARAAGVNKGTVSRALRGVPGVGPSTRARILAAADRLNFSASHIATALATGHSRTVGIVLPTLRSWYFSYVASGASEILIPAGFRVELINLDIDSDFLEVDSPQFRQLLGELGAGRGRDALLFAGTISDRAEPGVVGTGHVPAAAIGSPLARVPGIYIDNHRGGALIAEHLVALGHRNIAVLDGRVPGKPRTHIWDERTNGLRDTVRAYGFDVDNGWVIAAGDAGAADGERAMQAILGSGRPLPTAVFCHTDELAFGALAALRRAGLRCPEDISVAGFDDHPMSRFWGLTTVSQHAHEQGVRAASALIESLSQHPRGPQARPAPWPDLTVELVVRETTRAL